jgi:lipopolysaccharide biosynthesis glycosyltransferase
VQQKVPDPYILVESYSYSPFGIMTIKDQNGQDILNSLVNNEITYTGRRYDAEYRGQYRGQVPNGALKLILIH